jgi:hypothetical protein
LVVPRRHLSSYVCSTHASFLLFRLFLRYVPFPRGGAQG